MSQKRANHIEQRHQAKGSLEYFPTPPWATRTVVREILQRRLRIDTRELTVRDPCCGGGHMVHPLRDFFGQVDFSDVEDWGFNPPRRDFTFESRQSLEQDGLAVPDWIFINPPFEISALFLHKALEIATKGVAMFIRIGWLAGQNRFRSVFLPMPPTYVGIFSERVALIEGAWDPEASTATDYIWLVWEKPAPEYQDGFQTVHFAPGMQDLHTRLSDDAFASPGEAKRRAAERKAREAAG